MIQKFPNSLLLTWPGLSWVVHLLGARFSRSLGSSMWRTDWSVELCHSQPQDSAPRASQLGFISIVVSGVQVQQESKCQRPRSFLKLPMVSRCCYSKASYTTSPDSRGREINRPPEWETLLAPCHSVEGTVRRTCSHFHSLHFLSTVQKGLLITHLFAL